jgi:Uma2 family endonuclease
MSTTLSVLSVSEYLEKERISELRTEYYRGEERKLTGASYFHNKIVSNLLFSIRQKCNSKLFNVLSTDMKVWVPVKESFSYPDLMVIPNPPLFHDEQKDIIINPICIFEVLSDSTRNFDKGEKFDTYRSIKGFHEYYLVEQNKKNVIQYTINSKGNWELVEFSETTSKISLPTLSIDLDFLEIYEGIL